jgi:hypothetical protein
MVNAAIDRSNCGILGLKAPLDHQVLNFDIAKLEFNYNSPFWDSSAITNVVGA